MRRECQFPGCYRAAEAFVQTDEEREQFIDNEVLSGSYACDIHALESMIVHERKAVVFVRDNETVEYVRV